MKDLEKFYNGIFRASPRKFGSLSEIMIEALYKLYPSNVSNYDRLDQERNRIEIKFSRCSSKVSKSNNIIEEIINENEDKYISSTEKERIYWCNIQQIKTNEFDYLYYGIFYTDKIIIFKTLSSEVQKIPGYSNKQHRGNVGEGQFPLTNKTIEWHIKNNYENELSYNQLYDLLVKWNSK